ncbi:hypothetical protein FHW88_000686 [Mucilaginibacter sp. SG538B]|jgi:hypothetical protein|nr:hypothetical protein [Mucilaginibacter sp. SG538B]
MSESKFTDFFGFSEYQGVMLSLSKHGGEGLCARPFDKFRVTGPHGTL